MVVLVWLASAAHSATRPQTRAPRPPPLAPRPPPPTLTRQRLHQGRVFHIIHVAVHVVARRDQCFGV